nr:O-antigen ligase family protein [Butyricimonas sp. Marseille-P2440]
MQLRRCRLKIIACILLVFLLFALILSGSRASYLACIGGVVYFYWNSFTCKLRGLNRYSRLIFIFLCICVIAGLYFVKKDSADGRLFIWRCTWDLFKERPYFGYGEHGFTAQYMFSQANYFKGHENGHFEFLADNVNNPFNEYLRLLIQRGLLGVLFTGLVVFWYWKNSKCFLNSRNRILFSLLLALGINSFFSYPFRYVYVWLCLVIIGAYMEQGKILVCCRLRYSYLFVVNVLIGLFSVYYLSKNIYGEVKWKQLVAKNQLKKSDACIIQYEKLYDILYGNPYFHYNYAVVLFELEHYQESKQELKVCQAFLNDMDTQLLSADINIQMGYDNDGENDLVIASYMCPNRFMPIYKLMLLSEKRGYKEKAYEYARIIAEKPVKVPSFTVTQIKSHALKRIREK